MGGAGQRDEPLDDLVEGVRRGDRDAVAAVYRCVAPALRGFLRRQVPHGEVADDLVEQAFVALLEEGHRIRGDGAALRAWLFRTARHDLLDWRKRAERRSEHELTGSLATSTPDPGRDPADRAVDAVGDPQLRDALAQLTGDQREVLELRLVAELSLAQVADLTGRSVGAVKLLQHRGVRRLAALLEVR